MTRPIASQVVVVTGAGSGIGRQTCIELARRGARVVAASRNQTALASLNDEVKRLGGTLITKPTDVTDYDQVDDLAATAVAEFGRIDTWVNNAGISSYGVVDQMAPEELRRVIEVNLIGPIHGMKAALPHLRASGDGVLINVSSTLGKRAVALQAAYCAAKHGVVGFAEALRLELMAAGDRVAVVDVLPSSINTPLFRHARSKVGVLPMPIPPVYEPEVVADTIVAVAERPVRTVFAGGAGKLLATAQRISPSLVDWYLLGPGKVIQNQLTDEPDDQRDNLETPSIDRGAVSGDFGDRSHARSLYTEIFGLKPLRGRALAALGVAATVAALRRRGRG